MSPPKTNTNTLGIVNMHHSLVLAWIRYIRASQTVARQTLQLSQNIYHPIMSSIYEIKRDGLIVFPVEEILTAPKNSHHKEICQEEDSRFKRSENRNNNWRSKAICLVQEDQVICFGWTVSRPPGLSAKKQSNTVQEWKVKDRCANCY